MLNTQMPNEITPMNDQLSLTHLKRDHILPSASNRKDFDPTQLQELTQSILAHGIQQPLIVRPHPDPKHKGKFEIVAGERRWLAAGQAKIDSIPCVVRALDTITALSIQATENLQRENLSAL